MIPVAVVALLLTIAGALPWDEQQIPWNLNQNQQASNPTEYWGEWEGHQYHASPSNWRMPFYALTLDRFTDGDPTNNEANGTVFEHNWQSNQFRFGGDLRGAQQSLEYLHGSGIRSSKLRCQRRAGTSADKLLLHLVYLTGSPFINMPWAGDGYGPLDFTLLDHHHGEIQDWRNFIEAAHELGMYIIMDNTVGTMGDLLGMQGWETRLYLYHLTGTSTTTSGRAPGDIGTSYPAMNKTALVYTLGCGLKMDIQ